MINWNNKLSIALLVILHLVGLFGFLFLPVLFVVLVPFHLSVIAYLLFKDVFSNLTSRKVLTIIAIIAWTVEAIGVNTGKIFGNYVYGDVLGFKILGTPLIIGLNWVSLVYAAYVVTSSLTISKWQQQIAAALMVLIIDLVLEPVAIQFGFWSWENNVIPLQNYLAWFVLAYLLLYFFEWFPPKKVSVSLAFSFLMIQFLFFVLINILV